jgi:hypothetical protein
VTASVRTFDTGATRDLDVSKLDYEGFLSPLVLERFAQYMHANRFLRDGSMRASDNWQKGIPPEAYMKSGFRHFFDWWKEHRGHETGEGIELAICGLLFNAMGYLHEHLQGRPIELAEGVLAHVTDAPMPPVMEELLERQAEEPDSLNAGQAYREHA